MKELFLFSLVDIKQHRLRSFLTTISMIVGAFVLSFFLFLGDSIRYSIDKGFKVLGLSEFIVDRYDWENEKTLKESIIKRRMPIGTREYKVLRKLESIKYVSRVIEIDAPVEFNNKRLMDVDIFAVDPDFVRLRHYKIEKGRILSFADNLIHSRNCVIGYEVAKELGIKRIPSYIFIKGRAYRVVGILKKQGEVLENKPDNVVFIPFNTVYVRGKSILLHAFPKEKVSRGAVLKEVKMAIYRVRKQYGTLGRFGVVDMLEEFASFKGVSAGVSYVFISISFIALLIGGIGIMNVMIASARERIHEIGILKSLGMDESEIFWMFIAESILLALLGGIVGSVLGYGISYVLLRISAQGMIVRLAARPIVLSLVFVVITGFIAGLYPAYEASRREIIEALRYL